jgi:hypothetical protein
MRDKHDEEERNRPRTGRDSGLKDAGPIDTEGGYGGGRERAEQVADHAFGERAWSEGRGEQRQPKQPAEPHAKSPEGVRDVGPEHPEWQERYTAENADKYGQAGGQPTAQRGPSQSAGGEEHKEAPPESQVEGGPRGGYGTSEQLDIKARDPRERR